MTDPAPFHITYNLNRLGQTADEIEFSADEDQRAAVARLADVLGVPKFAVRVILKKKGPNRFALSYELAGEVVQACVVTLEPLVARINKTFSRELHFTPGLKRA